MHTALLTLLLAATPAHSAEVVVLGRVTEVTMLPEGHARCTPRCTADQICVSNSCGCGEATIEVKDIVAGQVKSSVVVVPYRLGEWCSADFPLGELVLVRMFDGESLWSPAEVMPSGEVLFEIEHFDFIAGVRASELPAADGRASISALRKAAGP